MRIKIQAYFDKQKKWYEVTSLTLGKGEITGVKIKGEPQCWFPVFKQEGIKIELEY